jgi:hypothetical protein
LKYLNRVRVQRFRTTERLRLQWEDEWVTLEHNRLGDPRCTLLLQDSLIQGAGEGVFTLHDITPGRVVTEYTGHIVIGEKNIPYSLIDYSMHISGRQYKVGVKHVRYGDGFGSKCNCGKPLIKPNAEIVYCHRRKVLYVRSIRFIPAGSEIYVSYGVGYWNQRRAQHARELEFLREVFQAWRLAKACSVLTSLRSS